MSESERSNLIQALDLRHDEVLASLAELDQEVEKAIALVRPLAVKETPAPTTAPPTRRRAVVASAA
jgi:hypothetical protein